LERIFLADHLHVAAHRNRRQAVLGLLAPPARQYRTKADREALDADTGPAGHQEVAELVDEDQDADDDNEREDGGHGERAPRPASRAACTTRRVSASTATHASIEPRSPAREASSASSMSSAIALKPMRRSRKAATATSLAALSTTGAELVDSSAVRASLRHGNLSTSGS